MRSAVEPVAEEEDEHTYWLAPDGEAADRPYRLLLAVMEDRQRVGIGTVVMRNKQYLGAVRPLDGALALSTMRFADEVVPKAGVDGLPERATEPDPKELKLAGQIVDSLASDWKPEQYHDTYTEELEELIARKAKGEDLVVEERDEGPDAEIIDLMAALEASISSAKGARAATSTAKKKRPPSKTKEPRSKETKQPRSSAGRARTTKKAAAKKASTTRSSSSGSKRKSA